MEQKVTVSDEPSFKSTNTRQPTPACEQEAVAGATEQAKDAVQQAGEQVRTRLKELESMQLEIDRLKQAPVSVSEDAQNQLRIQQLERDVLQVQQEINVHLEIAEQEVKEVNIKTPQAVYLTVQITWLASIHHLRMTEGMCPCRLYCKHKPASTLRRLINTQMLEHR